MTSPISHTESTPLGISDAWFCLDSGPGATDFNMAFDEALLESMPRLNRPVLRFYGWKEAAASFGYFQRHTEVQILTALRPLVRRPTAGGIVPHDADWTYSLAFPTSHEWYGLAATESYYRMHAWIRQAFLLLAVDTELAPSQVKTIPGQCFVGHERGDLLCLGRKIAGAAQRRRKDGLLIQGSVHPPVAGLARAEWQKAMLETASGNGVVWQQQPQDPLLQSRSAELCRLKYSQPAYNQRR